MARGQELKKWIVGAGFVAGLVLTCAQAFAQAPAPAPAPGAGAGAPAKKEGEGYGYEFSDDPLSAGGFGPNDATIRVRPGPVRTTLIRPRTSFVPEMLKSVENL
jgi:hypothetical protein